MKPNLLLPLAALAFVLPLTAVSAPAQPNILLIYADDLGYGDLSCYGATKVKTPNCDKLAAAGLRFTDTHAVAAVCTPSRYSLLSGEYAFRRPGTGIASGVEGLILDPARLSLPGVLKAAGYTTGIVGKWHLGLGEKPTDYNHPIKPGPNEVGFDYSWIIPATGDRVPCVWVENGRVVNLDPADPIKLNYGVRRGQPNSFLMGIPRIGQQLGGKAALWDDEKISFVIAQKGMDFIATNQSRPFFLELSTHNIHVPRVPNPMFHGQSDCGVRGDSIVEFDWIVGQVLGKLDQLGLATNTLVILTGDNGGVNDDNGPDKVHGLGDPDATNGHQPNGVLRGQKGTIWEGGTRIPMIVRWPGQVKAAGISAALVSQVDFLASFAALTGQTVPPGQARDSENHLEALLGKDAQGRTVMLEQTGPAAPFGLRAGSWKLIANHGGNRAVSGDDFQLYNLADDLGETKNLAAAHPEKLAAMKAQLEEITGKSAEETTAPKSKKMNGKQL